MTLKSVKMHFFCFDRNFGVLKSPHIFFTGSEFVLVFKLVLWRVNGHFVPRSFCTILVISYQVFDHFVPSNNHFLPRSFRTHFGHVVPSSPGYEMTFESQFVPRSFRTYFGQFVPILVISYLGHFVPR